MSGGGARGAYEAGVLSWVFGDLARRLGRPPRFDIVTGSSVGGVHACFVAGAQHDPRAGERLADVWRSLSLNQVFSIGAADLFRVPWHLIGFGSPGERLPAHDGIPERMRGLFDTSWLEAIVLRQVDWPRLHGNVADGTLRAVAVATTEIGTGRSVMFVERGDGTPEWKHDPFVVARATRVGPEHALASAAIPLLFPAVQIDGVFHCDGGLRLNTPLSPALRLGADRVLVIGLRYPRPPEVEDQLAHRDTPHVMTPTYLIGKALNALLLDRVELDLDRLQVVNAMLAAGVRAYGPAFLQHVNEPLVAMGRAPYRIVPNHFVRPSRDLGALAAECLRHQRRSSGLRDWLSRNVARYAGRRAAGEADLLSYLFFDSCYADHLIELGRADAERSADELAAFFS